MNIPTCIFSDGSPVGEPDEFALTSRAVQEHKKWRTRYFSHLRRKLAKSIESEPNTNENEEQLELPPIVRSFVSHYPH